MIHPIPALSEQPLQSGQMLLIVTAQVVHEAAP
jgi:hypothetical protein